MKRLIAACAALLLLTGCGQIETTGPAGQLLPISALALSLDDSGQVSLTTESIRQDNIDGDASPEYLHVSAATPAQAFALAAQMLSNKPSLCHTQTIIIDEAFARKLLPDLVSYLIRQHDVRLTMRIVTAQNASAEQVLRAEALAEGIPGLALASLLDRRVQEGSLPDLPLCRLLDRLAASRDFALPALTVSDENHVSPYGEAQFSDGRLTGFSSAQGRFANG